MNTQNFIKKIKESRKNNKVLRNILTVLGCLVFFVTTYVFLLPALAYSDPIDYTLTFNREKTIEKYTETIIENEETKEVEKQREIDNNIYAKINYVYFEKNNRDDTLYYLNHNSLIVDKNMKLEELFANSTTIEQDETIYEFEEVEIYINDEWIKLENEQVELKDNNWYIGEYQIDNNTNLRVVYTYEYEENTIIEDVKELAETIIEKPKAIFRSFAATPSTDPENLTQDQICDTNPLSKDQLSKNTYSRGALVNPCNGKSVDKVAIYTGSFANPGDVQVRKIVEKTDVPGKYNVKFQVRGMGLSGQISNKIFVVVVLDVSNSMKNSNTNKKWDNAKSGATTFASTIIRNFGSDAQIALVKYSGGKGKNDSAYNDASVVRGFESKDFSSVSFGTPSGGTNTQAGLDLAYRLLTNKTKFDDNKTNISIPGNNFVTVPDDVTKYVVLISDGEPTYYYNSKGGTEGSGEDSSGNVSTSSGPAKTAATTIKNNGITIYALGYDISNNSTADKLLKNDIASSANHYFRTDQNSLASKFEKIAQEISTTAGSINGKNSSSSGIIDNAGIQFTWGNGQSSKEYKFAPDTKIDIVPEWTTIASSAIEDIGDPDDGLYKTNNTFKLNYLKNSFDKDGNVIETPTTITCDVDPYAYWSQTDLIINYYYDGVKDESRTQTLVSGESGFKYTEGMTKGINNQNVQDNLKDGYIFIDVKDKNGTVINPNNGEYNIPINIERGTNIINVYYVSGHELPETGSRGELICLYMGLTIMLGTLIYGYIYYKKETN